MKKAIRKRIGRSFKIQYPYLKRAGAIKRAVAVIARRYEIKMFPFMLEYKVLVINPIVPMLLRFRQRQIRRKWADEAVKLYEQQCSD